LSPKLNAKLNYPYLLLLISGGHTQFLSVNELGKYKRLGTTIDDAVGEAFDKTAKMLGIEFPGGPKIELYAKKGNPNKYELPKPIFNKGGCNLSFAGLKTAVLRIVKKINGDKNNTFVVAGGVAANKKIRQTLTKLCEEENFNAIFPPIDLCGDNAAMIAMVGMQKFKLNQFSELDHPAKPRWPLDVDAAFLKGAGIKL
jgi:N6-L-threonylcarbamoyladenine synthase